MMATYDEMKEELKAAYADLLAVQYHGKPKAIATVKLHAEQLLSNMIMHRIAEECLNVDFSIGVQLDVVGKWVGVDRYFKGQKYDNKMWEAYLDWNDETDPNTLQGGLQDWNNERVATDGPFLTYDFIMSTKNILNDDDFRMLIKLKIIKNNTVMTARNIDESIYKMFGNIIYTTWGECMELTYNHPYSRGVIMELAKEKNVLPVPTGVKLKLQEIV